MVWGHCPELSAHVRRIGYRNRLPATAQRRHARDRQEEARPGADPLEAPDCHTSPPSWAAWEERSADRAREPSGCSQGGGKLPQRSRQGQARTKRSGIPGCVPPQSEALGRIERTRAAQREAEAELAVLVDHAVILGIGWPGGRRSAGRDQAGSPPALPAPPP